MRATFDPQHFKTVVMVACPVFPHDDDLFAIHKIISGEEAQALKDFARASMSGLRLTRYRHPASTFCANVAHVVASAFFAGQRQDIVVETSLGLSIANLPEWNAVTTFVRSVARDGSTDWLSQTPAAVHEISARIVLHINQLLVSMCVGDAICITTYVPFVQLVSRRILQGSLGDYPLKQYDVVRLGYRPNVLLPSIDCLHFSSQ